MQDEDLLDSKRVLALNSIICYAINVLFFSFALVMQHYISLWPIFSINQKCARGYSQNTPNRRKILKYPPVVGTNFQKHPWKF